MKAITQDYLGASARALEKSRTVLGISLFDEAGRPAYYAMFHAAQAFIYERTDKIAKTHKGVGKQFHQFAKEEPLIGKELAAGLSNAYRLKEAADYEVGDGNTVTREVAIDAIAEAEKFVARVRQVIEAGDGTTP